MRLNRTSWHYKVYAWWWRNKYIYEDEYPHLPDRANLCPYVRAVLLFAPLAYFASLNIVKKIGWVLSIAFALVVCLMALFVLTAILVGLFLLSWTELAKGIGIILGAVFICWFVTKLADGLVLSIRLGHHNPNTTWNMGKAFVKSLHNKVCPFITFE